MNRIYTCLLASLLLLGTTGGCSTEADESLNPADCSGKFSDTLIEQLSQEPKRTPAAEIKQYTYQGQTVYLVTGGGPTSANGAAPLNYLFDSCGAVLCAASGGPANNGDGRCPDFKDNATNPVLVWRDPR